MDVGRRLRTGVLMAASLGALWPVAAPEHAGRPAASAETEGGDHGSISVFWPAEGAVVRPSASPLGIGIRLRGMSPHRPDNYYSVRVALARARWWSEDFGGLLDYEFPYAPGYLLAHFSFPVSGVVSTTTVLQLPDFPESPGFYTVDITAFR